MPERRLIPPRIRGSGFRDARLIIIATEGTNTEKRYFEDFKKGYDELWLVIDIDRWKERNLSEVAELCAQKRYEMAASNPCFELWLLIHLKSLGEYDEPTLDEFRENKRTGDRSRLDIELVKLLGSYNKSDPDTDSFLPHVGRAIVEAQRLDVHPEHRWPNDLGSRVYLLAERIIRNAEFIPQPKTI